MCFAAAAYGSGLARSLEKWAFSVTEPAVGAAGSVSPSRDFSALANEESATLFPRFTLLSLLKIVTLHLEAVQECSVLRYPSHAEPRS